MCEILNPQTIFARDEFGSIDENEILEVVCFNDDNQKGRGRT